MLGRLTARLVAGLTLTISGFGLASVTGSAAGVVSRYVFNPSPIAAPASLTAGATVPMTLAAQDSTGAPVPGASVFLSFQQTTNGGSASVGTTSLTSAAQSFVTDANGQIVITYAASTASPLPTGGQDVVRAGNTASDATVAASDGYKYSPVSKYAFMPTPIAPAGTLGVSQTITVTLTAQDNAGAAVPNSTVYLSFAPVPGGGSATVGTTALKTTPKPFAADSGGQISIVYQTPASLPGAGSDILRAQDAINSPSATGRDIYSYNPLFLGMYTLDGYGGLHPDGGSAAMAGGAYWPGFKIARSTVLLPDATGGYLLDGYGGLHPFGSAAAATNAAYFPGFDIARDLVLLPSSTSNRAQGYTLDGYGGLHPFGGAPKAVGAPYFAGFDIAKRVVLLSDGTGGYVLDGWGGLHPFAVGTKNVLPPAISNSSYWPHFNIARDVVLTPGSTAGSISGMTLDGYGGVHPFGSEASIQSSAYWPSWDIARAVRLAATSTASAPRGWVLDGYGGLHPFGGAPAETAPYFGFDIAVQLALQ